METKTWGKMGRDILTLYFSLLLDIKVFRKLQWNLMLAWKIYIKREFILYTGYKTMSPETMNGNNKTRTEGTAPGILRNS